MFVFSETVIEIESHVLDSRGSSWGPKLWTIIDLGREFLTILANIGESSKALGAKYVWVVCLQG